MHSAVLTFIVFLTVWKVFSAKLIEDAVRNDLETERIVRGKVASPGQFPWVAALHYNDQFICTSSIISPYTVLTAAHCVLIEGVVRPAEFFYAVANVSRRAPSVTIYFESVTLHPNFYYDDEQIDNDVAVFKTTERIPFSEEVHPICIARPNTPMMEYKKVIAMGWGNIMPSWTAAQIPDELRYANHIIIKNKICSFFNGFVNDDKICAAGVLQGIRNGDSGGPLVHIGKGKRPVEIGIASYINNVTKYDTFCGIWTRISYHYDFIMQAANDASICTV